MFGGTFKLGFIGEDVTETPVTGAVGTFLKEGSDTSKNFSEGVGSDFASFWGLRLPYGDSQVARAIRTEKENPFSFSVRVDWAT
jgi:hypothetical protein